MKLYAVEQATEETKAYVNKFNEAYAVYEKNVNEYFDTLDCFTAQYAKESMNIGRFIDYGNMYWLLTKEQKRECKNIELFVSEGKLSVEYSKYYARCDAREYFLMGKPYLSFFRCRVALSGTVGERISELAEMNRVFKELKNRTQDILDAIVACQQERIRIHEESVKKMDSELAEIMGEDEVDDHKTMVIKVDFI